jgi:hypothetical protein
MFSDRFDLPDPVLGMLHAHPDVQGFDLHAGNPFINRRKRQNVSSRNPTPVARIRSIFSRWFAQRARLRPAERLSPPDLGIDGQNPAATVTAVRY